MAKVTVAHKPELTKEQAQKVFADHFAGKYRVDSYRGPFRDFVVEKSPFVGVALKLEQTGTETRFVYNAFTARWWARVLGGMLVGPMLGRGLTAEVRSVLDSAPQFH